jgi:hypothetical protein
VCLKGATRVQNFSQSELDRKGPKRGFLTPAVALRFLLACLLSAHWAIAGHLATPLAAGGAKLSAAEASKQLPQAPRQADSLSAAKFAVKAAERQSWSGGDAVLPSVTRTVAARAGFSAARETRLGFVSAAPAGFRSRGPPAAV